MVKIERKTKETDINLSINMKQTGNVSIDTGLPFFDHILYSMAFHGGFTLSLSGKGDLEVDPHHLVEDTGLVLGQALFEFRQKAGAVARYGYSSIPMDDALSETTIDVCNRPYLVMNADFPQERSGNFDMFLLKEFFQALASTARINLHLNCRYGENSHHMAEALFKSLGKALKQAYTITGNNTAAMSTKGAI